MLAPMRPATGVEDMLSGQVMSELGPQLGPWLGYALGGLAALALIWVSFEWGSDASRFNVLLLVSGGLIGWVIGILMTPTPAEVTRFSTYGTVLSTFVSGYLVAKVDRLFTLAIRERGDVDAGLIGRALLFVSGLALGALFTYVWRFYVTAV